MGLITRVISSLLERTSETYQHFVAFENDRRLYHSQNDLKDKIPESIDFLVKKGFIEPFVLSVHNYSILDTTTERSEPPTSEFHGFNYTSKGSTKCIIYLIFTAFSNVVDKREQTELLALQQSS